MAGSIVPESGGMAIAKWKSRRIRRRRGWGSRDSVASGCARNVIELTASAAAELRRRRHAAGHPESIAVRVLPTKWADAECEVQFGYPVSDGRDLVGTAMGMTVLID